MTEREHHIVRWLGRPTSGRYVYRLGKGIWSWQCDLHDITVGAFHTFPTHGEALANALIHAKDCTERNAL